MSLSTRKERSANTIAKPRLALRHPLAERNTLCVELSPFLKPGTKARALKEPTDIPAMIAYLRAHCVPEGEIHLRPVDYDQPNGPQAIWVIIYPPREDMLRSQANRKGLHLYAWSNSKTIPPLSVPVFIH